jgi:heme oxygenase
MVDHDAYRYLAVLGSEIRRLQSLLELVPDAFTSKGSSARMFRFSDTERGRRLKASFLDMCNEHCLDMEEEIDKLISEFDNVALQFGAFYMSANEERAMREAEARLSPPSSDDFDDLTE